jgi:siroheme synthase-like protein
MSESDVYPVFLKLAGKPVLVVGAGSVAERKIVGLVEARALVRVVAPMATPALERMAFEGAIEWHRRRFEDADASSVWLIVASTNDPEAQRRVAAAADARRVFLIAVDDRENASAYSGAIVNRPPFTIAISSSGAAPAMTRLLREVIEHVLPSDEWMEHARRLRARWLAEATPMGARFGELVRELAAKAPI